MKSKTMAGEAPKPDVQEEGKKPKGYKREEKRLYRGITKEKTSGRVWWTAQAKYGGGRFENQLAAARISARAQKETLDDIKLMKALLPVLPVSTQQKVTAKAIRLCKRRYPGDAMHSDEHATKPKCWCAFKSASGMIPAYCIAKFD